MITMFKRSLYFSLMIIILAGLNACSGGNEKKNETNAKTCCCYAFNSF